MHLEKTPLSDAYVLHKPVRKDERGQFCRVYGADELENAGLKCNAVHVNTSTSVKKGTLRGIHFQYPPYAENKIVSCISGSIWDVAIDLRPNSATRFKWFGVELNPDNGKSLIVPEGFGHAFITLKENTTVIYVVSQVYSFENEGGARFDDKMLKIDWPIKPTVLSDKDQKWPSIEQRIEEFDNRFKEF